MNQRKNQNLKLLYLLYYNLNFMWMINCEWFTSAKQILLSGKVYLQNLVKSHFFSLTRKLILWLKFLSWNILFLLQQSKFFSWSISDFKLMKLFKFLKRFWSTIFPCNIDISNKYSFKTLYINILLLSKFLIHNFFLHFTKTE